MADELLQLVKNKLAEISMMGGITDYTPYAKQLVNETKPIIEKPLLKKIEYWREKCWNDTMSAKKSGYDDAIITIKQAKQEERKRIGNILYQIIVKSSDETDLTLEGEKRKLVFICNRLRPLINELMGQALKVKDSTRRIKCQ